MGKTLALKNGTFLGVFIKTEGGHRVRSRKGEKMGGAVGKLKYGKLNRENLCRGDQKGLGFLFGKKK